MTESIESLQEQMKENQQKIRELKKIDSEINLSMLKDKFTSDDPEEIKLVLTACYGYIANHRLIVKSKSQFVTNKQLRKRKGKN